MDKCLRYLKQWVLRCLPEKKRKKKKMNKIAHVFLPSIFKFKIREIRFKEHSRNRIATIYIHTPAHLDLRV
jgi:hypothetical protein